VAVWHDYFVAAASRRAEPTTGVSWQKRVSAKFATPFSRHLAGSIPELIGRNAPERLESTARHQVQLDLSARDVAKCEGHGGDHKQNLGRLHGRPRPSLLAM
jgi:hypothetical protein